MKRLIVCGAAMLALSACSSGWTSADKEDFVKTCTSSATANNMGAQQAKDYCECMLPKIQKKYPKKADAAKINTADAEIAEMAKSCLK